MSYGPGNTVFKPQSKNKLLPKRARNSLTLNAGYFGEGKEGKGYKKILMEEEKEGLGKQMRMKMKRIMTQGQKRKKNNNNNMEK